MDRRVGVALVLLAVVGCGGTDASASDPPPQPSTTATTATATTATTAAPDGAALAQMMCTNCHSTNGDVRVTAPTLFGLAGSTVTLADGSTVVADAAYIRNSIVDSQSQLTEGDWVAVMPEWYTDQLSDAQIDALVTYVQSLK